MSVKELKLNGNSTKIQVKTLGDSGILLRLLGDQQSTILDRNQAHLLMLYLQEHLK